MRIAIDAMGGDQAPQEVVAGVSLAARRFPDTELVLVGDESQLNALLDEHDGHAPNISIHHASETVAMDESARTALRSKPDSSIRRAIELVVAKEADAVVSAGNTAAAVAISTLKFHKLGQVQRPGIAVTLPTLEGHCILIDAGANINCKPAHLRDYGVMGSVLCEMLKGRKAPKVGLLNVGEEDAKGNQLVKQTYALLSDAKLNFGGNVEGNRIYEGDYDVIVCEGFAGNVILKTSEGLAECMLRMIKREMMKQWLCKLGGWLSKPAIRRVIFRIDFAEYGGAPLLGLDGITIICHGRSNSKAIPNAVRQARIVIESRLNEHILARLESNQPASA